VRLIDVQPDDFERNWIITKEEILDSNEGVLFKCIDHEKDCTRVLSAQNFPMVDSLGVF